MRTIFTLVCPRCEHGYDFVFMHVGTLNTLTMMSMLSCWEDQHNTTGCAEPIASSVLLRSVDRDGAAIFVAGSG